MKSLKNQNFKTFFIKTNRFPLKTCGNDRGGKLFQFNSLTED